MSAIEDWAWDQEVLGSDKIVLVCLAKHADWDTLECYPSQARIAKKCGISVRTVSTCLKNLAEGGFIDRQAREGAADVITINAPELRATPADSVRRPLQKASHTPANFAHELNLEPIKGNLAQARETDLFSLGAKPEGKSKADPRRWPPDGAFDAFWLAYPRKTAIGAARKAFDAAWPKVRVPDNTRVLDPRYARLTVLTEAISRQKPGWTDPKFIPHASTWLNQERWTDEGAAPPPRRTGADDWQ